MLTLLAAGTGGILLSAGCRTKSDGDGGARVRLIDAVPASGGLNVSVDGNQVWKRAEFRSSSGYQTVSSGTYPVRVDPAGGGAALSVRSLSFEKGHAYTVLALGGGPGHGAQLQVLEDGGAPLAPGRAAVRLFNASEGGGPLDLVVNSIVAARSVAYGGRGAALSLDGGAYDLQLAAAGTADVLAGPVPLRLEPGRAYTLVAMGEAGDGSLSLEAYPDAP